MGCNVYAEKKQRQLLCALALSTRHLGSSTFLLLPPTHTHAPPFPLLLHLDATDTGTSRNPFHSPRRSKLSSSGQLPSPRPRALSVCRYALILPAWPIEKATACCAAVADKG